MKRTSFELRMRKMDDLTLVSLKMEAVMYRRMKRVLFLFFISIQIVNSQYKVPDVLIEVLIPKGLRASISDAPNMSLFVFQAHVNRAIGKTDVGTISGEVLSPRGGRWVYEDPNIELKVGDVINYYVYVSVNKAGYLKDNLSFTVKDTGSQQIPDTTCIPTLTTVRGAKTVCSGETIFEDNFDNLNENVWQIEQKLPIAHPEYPFVSYQRLSSSPTINVMDGLLKIESHLQQLLPGFTNESIYSGTLDLFNGCTDSAEACYATASGANILPPIVSGRISSKGFVFRYGIVQVRAKLPQGDWLYPEILLEPFLNKYGRTNFASGVIKIATARGNKELYVGPNHFGNKVLYGGAVMDFKCNTLLINSKVSSNGDNWGNEFHTYTVIWEPDRLRFLVDDVEWARIAAGEGLRDLFSKSRCPDAPHMLWSRGGKLAPFDEDFHLTLGLAAGGITEFRDGLYTVGGRPKPWTNLSSKSKLHFWQDLDAWYRTWDVNSVLIVDSVKVIAL